jgi:thermitase
MRRKLVSVLTLVVILTSTLSSGLVVRPLFAGNVQSGLLSMASIGKTGTEAKTVPQGATPGQGLVQGSQSLGLSYQNQTGVNNGNAWNFSNVSAWANFTYQDGNKTRLIVGIDSARSSSVIDLTRLAVEDHASVVNKVLMGGKVSALVVELSLSSVTAFVGEVQSLGLASYVEPNVKVQTLFAPNDPSWSLQWGPQKIGADWAWNTTTGSHSVLVAVVDTGIDYNHPDLAANYVPLGLNWAYNNSDPKDDFGHGTHCAGIIAAVINNSVGVAGMAQVRIMAEKVLDSSGSGTADWVASGIAHAVDQGANVISLSLGSSMDSQLLHDAVKYAYNAGVLVVAAAGNGNSDVKFYPAAYPEVVSVAATDQNDNRASFSEYGDWIELSAPGVGILSTMPTYHVTLNDYGYAMNYDYLSGTSMACPHVAGLAALAWSEYANRTRDWIRLWLRYTADDLGTPGYDIYYGYGRIDARRVMEQVPPSHDLLISEWTAPPYVEPGTIGTINLTILNFGGNDETNVSVELLANDTLINSSLIGFLASGVSFTTSFSWSPTVEGDYNVTAYISPVAGETNLQNNVVSKYVYVGSPVKAFVLRSAGNYYSEIITNWQVLNNEWQRFGGKMVYIDYTTLNKDNITYEDLAGSGADVLIISCAYNPYAGWQYTDSEIGAITRYVHEGHGLIVTAGTFYYAVPNNNKLAPLFGINDTITWDATYTDLYELVNASHPIFNNVPSPLVFPQVGTAVPRGGQWDSSVLAGGAYLANGHFKESAIVAYRGLVYISAWLEVIPPYYQHHLQLLYNTIVWSRYQKPQHDVEVSLGAPKYIPTGNSSTLNVTVSNMGVNDETDVEVDLFIDSAKVDSAIISKLPVGASDGISYLWAPTVDKLYNVTGYSPPVLGQEDTLHNVASAEVFVGQVKFVLFDFTKDPYGDSLTNDYTLLRELLASNGFVADELRTGPIDSGKLAGYDILVVMDPEFDYSPSEIVTIQDWVAVGGALIVVPAGTSGYTPPSLNLLLAPYGVHFTGLGGFYGNTAADILSHPITQNVTAVYLDWIEEISAKVPSTVLAWIDLGAERIGFLSATADSEAIAVSDVMNNHVLVQAANAHLVLNLFNFAGTRPEHELAVSLDASPLVEPGASAILNATVYNYGSSNESNVELEILINETIADSILLPELLTNSSYTLSLSWTPTTAGSYNVTAFASPVAGEVFTGNNYASTVVIVRRIISRVAVLNTFYVPSYFVGGASNDYQTLVDALNARGFYAEALTNEEIMNGALSNFDVFVMVDNVPSESAVPFVVDFWQRGGGLIGFDSAICFFCYAGVLPSESVGYNGYGAYWDYGTSPLTMISAVHPVTEGYTVGQIISGTGGDAEYKVDALNGNSTLPYYTKLAENLFYSNGACVSAFEPPTCGKVVHIWDAQHWSNGNIQLMILNALQWATKPRYEHDLSVTLETPASFKRGDSALVNCSVANSGINNETNVTLNLLINDTVADFATVPELDVGQSYTLSYLWMPAQAGDYNITAYSPPVLGEEYTLNNVANAILTVLGIHDVSVIDVQPSAHEMLAGNTLNIGITVANNGDYPENLSVTAYASPQENTTTTAHTFYNGTTIYLDPSKIVFNSNEVSAGYRFNVTVRVADVENMYSWEVKMFYNNTMVNATRWFEPTWDPEYVFYKETTVNAENFGADNIIVFSTLLGQESTFNGSGKLCIIEFEIANLPPPGQKYSCTLSINNEDTFLLDGDINTIPAAKENGYYEVSTGSVPSGYIIGTVPVTNLGPGETRNVTITWNTSNVFPGDYEIIGVASVVPGETHIEDNTFTDGVVKVLAHDVAVLDVTPSRNWVYQGLDISVSVTIEDKGNAAENVTVILYYNITANQTISTQLISIFPGENMTINFVWNTTSIAYCHNYTLTAVATIPIDNNLTDNTLSGGNVEVRILGDVNGDGKVDGKDIVLAAWSFGTVPGNSRWNPDADINQDGKIDGKDIVMVARSFGTGYTPYPPSCLQSETKDYLL